MLLSGRVAIVTGAGRGIGREFALCFAREGAAVVVDDAGSSLDGRDPEGDPAAAVCAEIKDAGGKAIATTESVADFAGAGRIVETALQEFGRVDILVNNAGILRNKPLLDMSEEDFDAVVDVHLKGTFNVTRHAAPIMKERGYGRIINISSGRGLQGGRGHTSYGAAKSGIMGLTFVWALELAQYGITVNALAPLGKTRMVTRKTGPAAHLALNAPLVAYLASERAAHVSGQIFGRQGFGFTIYQTPRPIATMWKRGGWTPEEVANNFDFVLGKNTQPVGLNGHRFSKRYIPPQ
jgi:NAD(P)-dependent dehydrogenase (short-subunit alcohol dehydrogenase family)